MNTFEELYLTVIMFFLEVDHVRQILIDLNRDQCLVLHGMMGCGKTSLATEAIYCNEVHELCKVNYI